MSVLIQGMQVRIYEDAVTEKKFEGLAELIRVVNSNVGWHEGRLMSIWRVRFLTDEEDEVYTRNILEPEPDF